MLQFVQQVCYCYVLCLKILTIAKQSLAFWGNHACGHAHGLGTEVSVFTDIGLFFIFHFSFWARNGYWS